MVQGVNRVLVDRGVFGLTLRAIAAESGISSGSLLHHYGSREHLLRVAAHRTGRRLVRSAESDSIWTGVDAFLPGDDDAVLITRAWLGWCELWRSESWLEPTVRQLRGEELVALASLHEHRLSRPDLDARAALVRELGVEPGPELQEMHQKILTADPQLVLAPWDQGGVRHR